ASNSYGHPHAEALTRLSNINAKVYGTDVNGTVRITTNGSEYNVQTEKEGTPQAPVAKEEVQEEKNPNPTPQPQPTQTQSSSDCIDINTASFDELLNITQIGEVRGKELIEKRPYSSVDQLTKIKGIGPAR